MKCCTTFQGVVLPSFPPDDDDDEGIPRAQDRYFDNRADKADRAHSGSSIASGGGGGGDAPAAFPLPFSSFFAAVVISTTSGDDGVFRFDAVVVRGGVEVMADVVLISDSTSFFARLDDRICGVGRLDCWGRRWCWCWCSAVVVIVLFFRFDDDDDDDDDEDALGPREDEGHSSSGEMALSFASLWCSFLCDQWVFLLQDGSSFFSII